MAKTRRPHVKIHGVKPDDVTWDDVTEFHRGARSSRLRYLIGAGAIVLFVAFGVRYFQGVRPLVEQAPHSVPQVPIVAQQVVKRPMPKNPFCESISELTRATLVMRSGPAVTAMCGLSQR